LENSGDFGYWKIWGKGFEKGFDEVEIRGYEDYFFLGLAFLNYWTVLRWRLVVVWE
jgi:hypothetical protein